MISLSDRSIRAEEPLTNHIIGSFFGEYMTDLAVFTVSLCVREGPDGLLNWNNQN